jgi:chromosome segregation ATPase
VTISWSLFLIQRIKHKEQLDQERTQAAQWEKMLEDLANENAEREKEAQLSAESEIEARIMAEEAQRMAELKAKEDEESRQQRIEELRKKLTDEITERREAENALNLLNEKLYSLENAETQAKEKLNGLNDARAGLVQGDSIASTHNQLMKKEEEIQRLSAERDKLEELYQVSLQRQMATEDELKREADKSRWPQPLRGAINAFLYLLGIKTEEEVE